MENKLMIFNSPEFGEIRTIEEDGKVLFCGSDVAKALGYKNPSKALSDHCKGVTKRYTPTSSGKQEMNFIPEGDIYRLAAKSELPGADRFESWIFDEVLPSIRKHGAYMTSDIIDKMITSPEFGIKLLTTLKDERDRRKTLEAANSALTVDNQIMKPKADYFDELVERNTLTNFRETAKQLGIPPKKFVDFLLEHKYVYRDKRGKLLPYQDKNNGLFEVKECFNDKTKWSGTQTLVTPKGRETFRLLYLREM
ncbi:phage antirepressor KilAC domain-containing protein [Flavonifractor plautii]|uniref:phage antirepressor KilAC domain-containing protein n=1 Tax=Flavonifractor plautii TaxID=292800 RepID=UPI001898AF00|nr:phage antirepressor KilAC domain-containing protein [Flavonifractor plautii]